MNTDVKEGEEFFHKDNFENTCYKVIKLIEKGDNIFFYLLNKNDYSDIKVCKCEQWGKASPSSNYNPVWATTKKGAYNIKLKELTEDIEKLKNNGAN